MDALILQSLLPGLAEELRGRPVTKVELVGRTGVLLRFGGSRRLLFLSAHPELSRVGLIGRPPPLGEPRPAPSALGEPLKRSRLVHVGQPAGERIVILEFENEEQRHTRPRLVVELIPRFANVILVGNEDRVLWTLRDFGGDRGRTITSGQPYVAPESAPGRGLADVTEAILRERLDATPPDAPFHRRIPRAWGGGAQGFLRAFEAAGAEVPALLLRLAAAAARPVPHLLRAADDELFLVPGDPGDVPGLEVIRDPDPHATVDRWYRAREREEATDSLATDLRRVLVRRRGRAAKALQQIESRLADSGRAEELRASAELLAAHQGQLRRGMNRVRLPRFDGAGEVEIALDPKLDAAANVEAMFKKSRRAARGLDELLAQKSIQQTELADVDRGLAALEADPAPEDLRALAAEFASSLLSAKPTKTVAAKPEAERHPSLPEGFQPRVYDLPGGWVVWVGRNARQNDELSHRRASNKDLWFHARGAQGSHTVLRMNSGKGEPPKEILEMAASIAAFHSKARNSRLVPVSYCEKRYVRKPRGAPAGTASIMREKVLMVEPKEPAGA
ncbi:MAG: NFACT family protein [bacterium]